MMLDKAARSFVNLATIPTSTLTIKNEKKKSRIDRLIMATPDVCYSTARERVHVGVASSIPKLLFLT